MKGATCSLSRPKSAVADFGVDAQTGSARFAKRGEGFGGEGGGSSIAISRRDNSDDAICLKSSRSLP